MYKRPQKTTKFQNRSLFRYKWFEYKVCSTFNLSNLTTYRVSFFFFLFLYEMLECLVGRIFTHNSEFLSGDNIHVTNVFSRSKLPAPPSLFLVSSAQVQTYEELLFHRTPDAKRPNRQHRPHRWAFERMQALTQSRKERTQAQSILESPRAVATTTRTDVTHRCYHHAPPLFSCQRGSS